MALNVSNDAQLALFKKVLGEYDPTYAALLGLVAKGAKIDISLYVVKILYKGQTHSQVLTVGTSAILKNHIDDQKIKQQKFLLKQLIDGIVGVSTGADPTPVPEDPAEKPASASPEWLKASTKAHNPATAIPVKPKFHDPKPAFGAPAPDAPKKGPVYQKMFGEEEEASQISSDSPVIKLKDATALGQRVAGTSISSIYRVIALNPRVKVASQIQGKQVSLRVEVVSPTPEELECIKSVVDWKGSYGSKHMNAGSVPVHRLVGAVLFSMGIGFTKMVHGQTDLEVANA